MTGQVATAGVEISASPGQVWTALTDPKLISKYMFGAQVETSWEVGTPILWKGEYEGKTYEDKGEIVEVVPEERLTVTHFSPLTGQEDKPENYHTVTYELTDQGDRTELKLEQDNNPDDEAVAASEANWETVLNGIKELVERS